MVPTFFLVAHMACSSNPKKVHAWKGKFLIYVKAINISGMPKHQKEKKNGGYIIARPWIAMRRNWGLFDLTTWICGIQELVEGVDSLYRSSKHNKTYEQYDTRKINSVLTLVSLGKLITKSIILNTDKVKLSYKFLEAVSYKFPHCINWWIT